LIPKFIFTTLKIAFKIQRRFFFFLIEKVLQRLEISHNPQILALCALVFSKERFSALNRSRKEIFVQFQRHFQGSKK